MFSVTLLSLWLGPARCKTMIKVWAAVSRPRLWPTTLPPTEAERFVIGKLTFHSSLPFERIIYQTIDLILRNLHDLTSFTIILALHCWIHCCLTEKVITYVKMNIDLSTTNNLHIGKFFILNCLNNSYR